MCCPLEGDLTMKFAKKVCMTFVIALSFIGSGMAQEYGRVSQEVGKVGYSGNFTPAEIMEAEASKFLSIDPEAKISFDKAENYMERANSRLKGSPGQAQKLFEHAEDYFLKAGVLYEEVGYEYDIDVLGTKVVADLLWGVKILDDSDNKPGYYHPRTVVKNVRGARWSVPVPAPHIREAGASQDRWAGTI